MGNPVSLYVFVYHRKFLFFCTVVKLLLSFSFTTSSRLEYCNEGLDWWQNDFQLPEPLARHYKQCVHTNYVKLMQCILLLPSFRDSVPLLAFSETFFMTFHALFQRCSVYVGVSPAFGSLVFHSWIKFLWAVAPILISCAAHSAFEVKSTESPFWITWQAKSGKRQKGNSREGPKIIFMIPSEIQ